MNSLRSRRRERSALDTIASYEGSRSASLEPEADLDTRAEIERLRLALSGMKEAYAEAVVLHDVLGYRLPDIAQMSGVSIAAAQSRLVRGRRELYRRMGWPDRRSARD
jgi:RNA polymerase sigma-70 factor (ECF subfamily)